MAQALYNEAKRGFLAGEIDCDAHTLKLAMLTGYTPNIDAHNGYADVSAFEVSGAGYTAGGAALASKTVTEDTTNDRGVFDAADVTWTALNVGTPSHVVLYDDTHATKILLAYWDCTTPTNGGNYTIQWNASGILLLT